MKEPLDPSQEEALDLQTDLKLHVISGGTRVVQHTPPDKNSAGMRVPDNGCIGYVLGPASIPLRASYCGPSSLE